MNELEYWLRLWHIPKVGPKTFLFLLSKYPQLSDLFNAPLKKLLNQGVPHHIADSIVSNESELYLNDIKWLDSNKRHQIILFNQPSYPQLLRAIPNPPPILYIWGDVSLLGQPLPLAIVGGRKAGTTARKIAYFLAKELSEAGVTVISGLARGIDKNAHEGALASRFKSTVAVLANGLDRIYPSEHRSLGQQIANEGTLVSEFPPGAAPLAQHFPKRNRIISGLCLGTLVIEAAEKSGSLITANCALEQGRDVFAVPGLINNPHNHGCHQLIQQGAKLVTNKDDILAEIAPMMDMSTTDNEHHCLKNHPSKNHDIDNLLKLIEYEPISMEVIIEKSGLTPEQVSSMLTELELSGHVAADAFGQYSRL